MEQFSWRAVYFLSAPISIGALVISILFIPESKKIRERKIDWLGTLLVFLGFLGMAYGLISGPIGGWRQSAVLAGLIGGAFATSLFILREFRRREPLVPRQIFKNPLISGANGVTLLLYFALNGISFYLILNLEQIQGYSPAAAGLALLGYSIVIALFSGPAGLLSDRIGPRTQMVLGPAVVACGAAYLSVFGNQANYLIHFLPGLILVGAGMALVIAPLTKSALMVKPEYSGSTSGVNNAVARYAALLAIAILGVVMLLNFTAHLHNAVVLSGLAPGQQQQILRDQSSKLGGIVIPSNFDAAAASSR